MNHKLRGAEKLARIPIKVQTTKETLPKPEWLKIKLTHSQAVSSLKTRLRSRNLVTVCEEANCPNLNECFSQGTATFMIMGDLCTRRCSFCDVAHGRPQALDPHEPEHLALTISEMGLSYVVITSVDRDDLRDGGGGHFAACIRAVRDKNPNIKIEILVPDFRGRVNRALDALAEDLPDVLNHNIETVPRLYKQVRPGSDYQASLSLLQTFKQRFSGIPTKSGLMLGLGEQDQELEEVLRDLRIHEVDMLTLGQYLQPSPYHTPVDRYVTPQTFAEFAEKAKNLGFTRVASGPFVRSSYHADRQASGEEVC